MSWSKVDKTYRKPLIWWYHKILCELYWHLENNAKYYYHLHKCVDNGFTLYGKKI